MLQEIPQPTLNLAIPHRCIKTRYRPPRPCGLCFLLLACFHVYQAAHFYRLGQDRLPEAGVPLLLAAPFY